jgi:hypothetical protein
MEIERFFQRRFFDSLDLLFCLSWQIFKSGVDLKLKKTGLDCVLVDRHLKLA